MPKDCLSTEQRTGREGRSIGNVKIDGRELPSVEGGKRIRQRRKKDERGMHKQLSSPYSHQINWGFFPHRDRHRPRKGSSSNANAYSNN
jgi:hypothetical protein